MNQTIEDILGDGCEIDFREKPAIDDILHYGVKRRSGRYPWGSGENPYQHSGDFLSRIEELKAQNITYTDPETGKTFSGETAIAKTMGLSTTDYRVYKEIAKNERRNLERDRAISLKEDGYNPSEIARIMGYNSESSIRALLNDKTASRKNKGINTAERLKEVVEKKGVVDIGKGVEKELGVSENTLKEAEVILEAEGYKVYGIGVPNVTNPGAGHNTNTKVLCKSDITEHQIYQDMSMIKSVADYYSPDGGDTFRKLQYPASIDSKRVSIRYGDEGGMSKDGVIEIRRGVPDLDLGNSHYAQVRILVDGTHYLKGMAMYSDDIPTGADIVFNTNKKSGTDKKKVLKKISDDPDNPFGAAIKANGQSTYIGKDGKEKLSAINKLKEEGDWDSMSKNLSSQFLSKQPVELIRNQLKLTYNDEVARYDEICNLTNPTIKRKMLNDFADECDSACVHLKAASLPRQSTRVILPVNDVKETEIYAPSYRNGERVALVRYPHAGTFEIPILTVNNKNKAAQSILGPDVSDAVGINAKVAERLSGADFDGDQVIVIPTNSKVRITSTSALKDLKNFDPKTEYSTEGYKNFKPMSEAYKQKQMGIVSNLITDMTLKGAPESDIAKAVKHSMVVIDAVKHELDYRKSEKDNDIETLKRRWQRHTDEDGVEHYGGASTLLSKRKQDVEVPERRGSGRVDPETGKVVYKESGRTYINPETGKVKTATQKVKLLNYVDDAHTLSTGTPQEELYADYINKMKALSNTARKEALATGRLQRSASAAKTYEDEVRTLDSKLNIAKLNAPRERQAQVIANSVIKAKIQDNPDLGKRENKKELKKVSQRAIVDARIKVGATGKETRITITDREWEAIQAGAISDSKLTEILRYTKDDEVVKRATPKAYATLSNAQINKIKAMSASGYTIAEIAERMGKSTSTISKYLKE